MIFNYRGSVQYITATKQEQIWIDTFATTGDIIKATVAAYDFQDEDNTAVIENYAKSVAGREKIKTLIASYGEKQEVHLPTLEELRERYIEIADNGSATIREKLQALIAYERVSGFNKVKPKPEGYDTLDDITG
jgi:hypothetical protein